MNKPQKSLARQEVQRIEREELELYGRLLAEADRRQAKAEQSQRGWYDEHGVRQGGLIAFVRYFWPILEPATPLVDGWPLWAMCEHLEAVTFGEITRLLINVPPGFMKSLLVDVFFPAWEWGPIGKTHYRYVTFSYSSSLTERDNGRFRDLLVSVPYQKLYGPLKTAIEEADQSEPQAGVGLRNKTIIKVMNSKTGWKLASSVGGVGTGERGDRVVIDDPINIKESGSEIILTETARWFRESISSRFNNLESGALIIIMQRVHEDDISGVVLSEGFDYCHLMIPWEFDASRQTDDDGIALQTDIGWSDPRCNEDDPEANNGEPAWPERFTPQAMARTKHEVGPYAWAGQYQQAPAPRGGGIFQRDWWQLWESTDGKFPVFEFLVASLDSAFTEKEQNDPSGLTVWGVFVDKQGHRRVMLVHAWRKHLQFSGPKTGHEPNESKDAYRRRAMPTWGLIEWVADTCRRFKVDRLLIEAKASGISAGQELQKRHGLEGWAIQLCPVKGDKVARALAVQATFSQLMIYAPARDWAEMVIDEMAVFPKGKYDDLTDSATQAIKHLRGVGLAQSDEEVHAEETERVTHKPKPRPLYPV